MYERLNLQTGDVFEASHVSHIEDGIVDCEDQCSELKDSLTEIGGPNYFTSFDELIAFVNSLDRYKMALVYVSNDLMAELGGGSGVSKGFVTRSQNTKNSFDYLLEITNGGYIYCGRVVDGVPTYCWQYNGTSISLSSVTLENSIK